MNFNIYYILGTFDKYSIGLYIELKYIIYYKK